MSGSTKRFFLGFVYLFYYYIRVCFQFVDFVREHIWHKAFLMGYSMRLEHTRVCSLNVFQLVMGFHGGHFSLFLSVFTLVCFTPHLLLIFDTLCVCVGGSFRISLTAIFSLCVCECLTGLVGRVFANDPGDLGSIPGRVIPKTFKMVLDTSLLNIEHYKVRIKGKVEQSRERSCTLPYTSV